MEPAFFINLPSEIITDILSRLNVRSIAKSKCVCKAWLDLLETDEFVKSHFSKSSPALVFAPPSRQSNWCKIYELEEDELDPEGHDPLTKLELPQRTILGSSANGLLFLYDHEWGKNLFYVCNPISREFCTFRCYRGFTYGFGASRVTGQFKVVSIDCRSIEGNIRFKCYVYPLGTGSWRCVEAIVPFHWVHSSIGTFFNGNLHWMVELFPGTIEGICCFDLETERFSSFTIPPLGTRNFSRRLHILRKCLSFCDEWSDNDGVVIWMMKEYGVEKSWTKEYVISRNHLGRIRYSQDVIPIKVFKNDDILMLCSRKMFMYYSKKTNTSQEIGRFFYAAEVEDFEYLISVLLTPSLVSLKTICGVENVISF